MNRFARSVRTENSLQVAARRSLARHCATGLAVGCLLLQVLAAHGASAAVGSRSDPTLSFSNGVQLNIGVVVADPAADVSLLQYTVHTPKGVRVSVTYPAGDPLTAKERFIVQQDNPTNLYTVYSILQTYTPNQTYTVYISNAKTKQQVTAAGSTGQTVTLTMQG